MVFHFENYSDLLTLRKILSKDHNVSEAQFSSKNQIQQSTLQQISIGCAVFGRNWTSLRFGARNCL